MDRSSAAYSLRERLSDDDLRNLMTLARAVGEVIGFDRGRLSGHGWEEMIEAYDAYWQERAHPLDDELILAAPNEIGGSKPPMGAQAPLQPLPAGGGDKLASSPASSAATSRFKLPCGCWVNNGRIVATAFDCDDHKQGDPDPTAAKIVPPKRDPQTGEPLTTATPLVATSVEHGHLCWLARAALEGAAVVFEDERVKYVEVQLDREDWLRWKEATDG